MSTQAATSGRGRPTLALVGIGLVAGFLSGLFGVGGGIVIVPALVTLARFPRKLASGTSLVSIIPTAVVGVVSYALAGHVDVLVALVLAAGSVVGAQLGAWLLSRLPVPVVRWVFIAFLVAVAVQLFLTTPVRTAVFAPTPASMAGLVALGLVTGVLSGLLGVGGGIVVVPALIVLFGVSDLVAKGSSLLMMIPTAVSGSIANYRRRSADIRAGVTVGAAACLTSAAGAYVSQLISPRAANVVFAVFLAAVIINMVLQARRRPDA